jgi:hypothetical protein
MKEERSNARNAETYLTTDELCERIKYKPGSINNLVSNGKLIEGIHFLKPTPKKRLFIWSRMEVWLRRNSPGYADAFNESDAA